MYYQLPNGKVVQMSVEEYLNLTKRDIQYLLSINAGDYISNPWTGSVISSMKKELEDSEDEEESDAVIFENAEEIETFFEEFFPEDFDDPDPRIDLDFNS
jgi:hypothetical protein